LVYFGDLVIYKILEIIGQCVFVLVLGTAITVWLAEKHALRSSITSTLLTFMVYWLAIVGLLVVVLFLVRWLLRPRR